MVVLAVDRLQLQVSQRVVHPTHIPFEAETESAGVHRASHAVEGGGFLRDHDHSRDPVIQVGVHVAQEVDCFQVFPTAVNIGDPLSFVAGVVEVEH